MGLFYPWVCGRWTCLGCGAADAEGERSEAIPSVAMVIDFFDHELIIERQFSGSGEMPVWRRLKYIP